MGKFPASLSNRNWILLPSLNEIEEIEKQRQKAIETLEIDSKQNTVKCQSCQNWWPMIKDDSKLTSARANAVKIKQLQNAITIAEKYHPDGSTCKREKDELKQLIEEEKQKDKLRKLPLYSNKMTGYKFLCGKCFDEAYYSVRLKHKKEEEEKKLS
jgi:hypothetical protein